MNPIAPPLLLLAAIGAGLVGPAHAQRQPGRLATPVAKLFIVEVKGETQVTSGGRVHEARPANTFDAPGAVIETQPDAHNAIVLSNGSGVFVDADTRLEIERFTQEPFIPSLHSIDTEPSISHSSVYLSRGFVGICTSQMASGSSMISTTAHAAVIIRGRKIGIRTNLEETTVYLLDGDVTVRPREGNLGGQLLRPGEQAVIRPARPGQPPSVTISPIPAELRQLLDDRVSVACSARRTVSFETIERRTDGDQPVAEIVPRPVVPAEVPPRLVVSPDRLPDT